VVRIRLFAGKPEYLAGTRPSRAVTIRRVRKTSRKPLTRDPQRPYAGHPVRRVKRWSQLHGDMQGWHAKGRAVRSDVLSKALSEIPCRVSSDLHEWRNELDAVSTRGSVKLESR
jgi:hypothetical protein